VPLVVPTRPTSSLFTFGRLPGLSGSGQQAAPDCPYALDSTVVYCTCVVAWDHACSHCQTRRRPKARPIDPNLRDSQFRPSTVYPRDGIQQCHSAGKRQGGRASGAARRLTPAAVPAAGSDVSSALRAARLASIAVLSASICSFFVSDHRGSNSQAIDFESVKIYPIFTVKIENPGKSNT